FARIVASLVSFFGVVGLAPRERGFAGRLFKAVFGWLAPDRSTAFQARTPGSAGAPSDIARCAGAGLALATIFVLAVAGELKTWASAAFCRFCDTVDGSLSANPIRCGVCEPEKTHSPATAITAGIAGFHKWPGCAAFRFGSRILATRCVNCRRRATAAWARASCRRKKLLSATCARHSP